MLNRKTLISIIAVLCCTQAFGAASVRTVGTATTPNTGGTAARAGSLRTVSSQPAGSNAKSVASNPSMGRIATSAPGSGMGVKTGKVLKTGSGVSSAVLESLEQRIDELRDTLDSRYNRLSSDVADASSLAVTAKQIGENNNTQMALKMNAGDFNTKFDERASTRDFATQGYVQTYVNQNAPTPDLTNYYTKGQVDTELARKVNAGEEFNNAFTARLAATSVESDISNLSTRVLNAENAIVNLEESPGVDTTVVSNMIDNKISTLASKTEVANTYSTKDQLMSLAEYVDTNTASIGTLNNQLGDKVTSAQFNSLLSQVSTNAQSLTNKVDVGVFNSAVSDLNLSLSNKVTTSELDTALSNKVTTDQMNAAIAAAEMSGEVDTSNLATKPELQAVDNKVTNLTTTVAEQATALSNKVTTAEMNAAINAAQLSGGEVDTSNLATKPELQAVDNKVTTNTNNIASLSATVANKLDSDAAILNKITTNETNIASLSSTVAEQATALNNKVTTDEMNAAISAAQLSGGEVDTSSLATKPELQAVDNKVTTNTNNIASLSATVANKLDSDAAILNKITTNETNIASLSATVANKLDSDAAILNKITTNETNIASLSSTVAEQGVALNNKVTTDEMNAAISAAQLSGGEVDTSNLATKPELQAVDNKVTTNTNNIASLSATVANKLDSDAAILNKITTNETNIGTNTSAIATLQSGLSTANGKITALETSDAEQNTNITSVTNKVNNLESNKIPQLEAASTQLSNALAQKPSMDDVNDAIAQAELGMDQDEVEAIIGHYLEGASFVTTETYTNKVNEIDSNLTTMNNKLAEKAPLSTVNALTTTVEGNTTNIGTLSTQKADKSALETAQATLTAAIATAEQSAKTYAEQYTNQKVMAGLCPDGQVEVATENTVNGKTYIVNCVQSD